ncbi:MAG: MlaE family lipid ABC transporter permease subunit [Rhodovibrionaceae bacterium]
MAGTQENSASYIEEREGDRLLLRFEGAWTTYGLALADKALRALRLESVREAALDVSGVSQIDTTGAWLIVRTRMALEAAGASVTLSGSTPARDAVFAKVRHEPAPPEAERGNLLTAQVERLGAGTLSALGDARDLLGFLGHTVIVFARVAAQPGRLRVTATIYHMQKSGFDALPIVGLISFLIGVVMAYQGADQLRRFGAEIFTVNLVGIAVLRELGILLTSIIVAGRSGSAFTAQIGTMKVNEEVDALRTIGLDPMEVLVLPRILALVLVLPLLTFYADIMGLLGGAMMAALALDISVVQFVERLREAITPTTFWVGMVKAPVFAFIIAMVGCFEGLQVTSSAESVGMRTTRSVVEAIFLVIVLDALFSIFFSYVGI